MDSTEIVTHVIIVTAQKYNDSKRCCGGLQSVFETLGQIKDFYAASLEDLAAKAKPQLVT